MLNSPRRVPCAHPSALQPPNQGQRHTLTGDLALAIPGRYQTFFASHKVWVETAATTLRNAALQKGMR